LLHAIALTILSLSLLPVATQAPAGLEAETIPNLTRPRPGLACAGQPAPDTLKRLAALGFRTVVNLRTSGEPGVAGEAEAVEAQGLRYASIPVRAETFSSGDVDAVAAVIDDPEAGSVLLHCGSSNRVGAVMAVLAAREGRSLEEALEEGRASGLRGDSMVAAAERVIASEASRR
jgi:uncharacterized protein (TIGR01244 family)